MGARVWTRGAQWLALSYRLSTQPRKFSHIHTHTLALFLSLTGSINQSIDLSISIYLARSLARSIYLSITISLSSGLDLSPHPPTPPLPALPLRSNVPPDHAFNQRAGHIPHALTPTHPIPSKWKPKPPSRNAGLPFHHPLPTLIPPQTPILAQHTPNPPTSIRFTL